MPDYKHMTAIEAMRHAKDVSGMTAEQIGEAAGISPFVVRRYLMRQGDGIYSPGMDKIPTLCRAMGNTVLLQWIEAQLEIEPTLDVPKATSRAEVLTAFARVIACMGDAQRLAAESEQGGIDPACAREMRGLLQDVIEECRIAKAMLEPIASARDITEHAPLLCLANLNKNQNRPRRPWWRVWG